MAPAGRPKAFDEPEALASALGVFWSKGFDGATMADLVEAMGIGRQSLYDTFGDKRALYLHALEDYSGRGLRRVREQLDGEGSPMERIGSVIDSWVAAQSEPACRGCMMVNTAAEFGNDDAEVAAIVDRHQSSLTAAFRRVIQEGQSAGEISMRSSADALASLVTCVGHGLSIAGKSGSGHRIVRDAADAALMALTTA